MIIRKYVCLYVFGVLVVLLNLLGLGLYFSWGVVSRPVLISTLILNFVACSIPTCYLVKNLKSFFMMRDSAKLALLLGVAMFYCSFYIVNIIFEASSIYQIIAIPLILVLMAFINLCAAIIAVEVFVFLGLVMTKLSRLKRLLFVELLLALVIGVVLYVLSVNQRFTSDTLYFIPLLFVLGYFVAKMPMNLAFADMKFRKRASDFIAKI